MLVGCIPWPRALAREYQDNGTWAAATLPGVLQELAGRCPERTFLVCGAERLSYRQTDQAVERVAAGLLATGLRPREIVLLQLPNSIEFVVVFLALLRIGVVPVLCLPAHRHTELQYFAGLTGASGYIFPPRHRDHDCLAMARELQQEVPTLRHLLVTGDRAAAGTTCLGPWLAAAVPLAGAVPPPALDPFDVAFMLLSGGTTGVPKLIPRTHADYLYNARECARVLHWGPDTIYGAALPAAHNFALGAPGIVAVMTAGGCVVLSASTQPGDVIAAIDQHRITVLPATPALLIRLLEAHDAGSGDLGSLRQVCVGGQRMLPELFDRLRAALPQAEPLHAYGMAEGLTNLSRPEDPPELRRRTQGRPVSPLDQVRIVDEQGADVADGEVGELLTRGPYTIRGYYLAARHNTTAFTADGFYRTGDLVRRDPSGNLVVEGRSKDTINRGGEKISAEEIENLILAHEDVRMTAVVAMPDPVLGERSAAFVVLRAGTTLSLAGLNEFLLGRRIARFKLPEHLEVVDSLPLTAMGKISKASLRERMAAIVQEGGGAPVTPIAVAAQRLRPAGARDEARRPERSDRRQGGAG